ncbi:MAG: acyl-CoA dehydrogenase [Actinobacteria bacterium]|nr:acyl-CoA dehydrogenase [Actinomycetota bacterium]
MDVGDSLEETAFRATARAWLLAHATAQGTSVDTGVLADHVRKALAWQRTLYEHGWAGISWPEAFGGRGEPVIHSAIFNEEMASVDETLGPLTVALGMVAPTLMRHGTPEQQMHLASMLRGEQLWCQLFSEPGAGSDLAALATRAERDGDEWVINGQKVWTSLGQFADYGILLARTDVNAPKHEGITYFIVDMTAPGIDIRPLVQMTGHAHFNEAFLTDVRIPKANVVGEVGEGWKIARTTLTSERASIAGGGAGWSVEELIDTARIQGVADDPTIRQELAQAHIRSVTLKTLGYRVRTAMSAGSMPGPEALVMKLAYARHWTASTQTAMSILGADGLLVDETGSAESDRGKQQSLRAMWSHVFLNQYAIRLGGGTDEVQQNIIGELALGLPREPSTDRGVPWKDLPK